MPDNNATGRQASPVSPQSLRLEDLARILSAFGPRPVTAGRIQADIDAGAPRNADGGVNLVHYVAWQIKELPRGA